MYLRVKKVLIVEDDFFIRKLYDGAFQGAGYEVSTTDNGNLAESLLEKEPFSVILLDMMLPDMSGVDILKKIRSTQNHNTTTPVFILTNNDVFDTPILKNAHITYELADKRWSPETWNIKKDLGFFNEILTRESFRGNI